MIIMINDKMNVLFSNLNHHKYEISLQCNLFHRKFLVVIYTKQPLPLFL